MFKTLHDCTVNSMSRWGETKSKLPTISFIKKTTTFQYDIKKDSEMALSWIWNSFKLFAPSR